MRVEPVRLFAAAALAFTLCACERKPPPAPPPPPPPEAGVVTIERTPVPVVTELPGRTSAFLVAQVRARVDGIVLQREFTEGAEVRAGQRLYQIDPAPYVAVLNSAKAALTRAEANRAAASAQESRYKALTDSHAVSRQDYDNAVAARKQAEADVAASQAAIDTAQINLGYTDVVSPISGKIGISQVTPGAYVQAAQATLMATVQQLDPIYVDLTQSSLDGLALRRAAESGRLQTGGPDAARVSLILEDGSPYAEPGQLQLTDVTVDPSTGSVMVRAQFPNPRRVLLPGMFVRARIEQGMDTRAMRVPQTGVVHDQKGQATVLTVDAEDKVQLKIVTASRTLGRDWVVEDGINPGDRVIVQGVEKVRPGMKVKPVPAH